MKKWSCAAVIAIAICLAATAASAQSAYPNRPVRLIVPMPAGGSVDAIARVMAAKLSTSMGQQVFVDNRPGGAATIGTAAVAKAEPDGYTLLMIFDGHAINPSLYSKLPYDSLADFTPIGLIGYSPLILTVHTSVPVKNVPELIRYAREKPDALSYSSVGHGTQGHLAGEMFKSQAGVSLLHVPYRGGGASQNDRTSGIVQIGFSTPVFALQQIRSGVMNALALAAGERIPQMPDLPTLSELGYPVEAGYWYGVLAPAKLDPAVLAKLDEALSTAIDSPEIRSRLTEMGLIATPKRSREFGPYIEQEMKRWSKVIKDLNISSK